MGLKRVHAFTLDPGTVAPNPGPGAANLIYSLETNQLKAVLNGGEIVTISSGSSLLNSNEYYSKSEVDNLLTPQITSFRTSGTLTITFDRASGRVYDLTGVNKPTNTIIFQSSGTTNTIDTIFYDKEAGVAAPTFSGMTQIGQDSFTDGQRYIIDARYTSIGVFWQITKSIAIPDVTAPTLSSTEVGTISTTTLVLDFNENLVTSDTPATTSFVVEEELASVWTTRSVSTVTMNQSSDSSKVGLTLGTAITTGNAVRVSYIKPETNKLRDLTGNEVASFTNEIVTNNVASAPTDSLIAFYPFVGNANDASGNGYDGIVSGATLVSDEDGNANSAYSFDGVDDFIDISSILPGLTGVTQGAIMCKFKPVDATPVAAQQIITFGDEVAGRRLSLDLTPTGLLRGILDDGGNRLWLFTSDVAHLTDGVEAHIGINHNGTTPTLWVNGASVAITFVDQLDKTKWFSQVAAALDNGYIGCVDYNGSGKTGFTAGRVDQVRIYSRSITSSEWTTCSAE